MEYSGFLKRAQAYFIDYLIVSIPIMLITSIIIFALFPKTSSLSIYPFIILMLIYCPYFMFGYLILYPIKNDILLVLASSIIIIILEGIIYTIMELVWDGQTLGKKIANIRVCECSILKKFFRNILKSMSKYCIGIPYLFVNNRKQTIYDLLLETYVMKN